MDWAAGRYTEGFGSGSQPEILGTAFIWRVTLFFERPVKTDLQSLNHAIQIPIWNEDAGCTLMEFDCPLSIVVHVETRNTLDSTPQLNEFRCQRAAQIRRWSTLKAKGGNLLIVEAAFVLQMLSMGRRQ